MQGQFIQGVLNKSIKILRPLTQCTVNAVASRTELK